MNSKQTLFFNDFGDYKKKQYEGLGYDGYVEQRFYIWVYCISITQGIHFIILMPNNGLFHNVHMHI